MARVWLWRYANANRNYRGYHLTADTEGARTLASTLSSLGRRKSQSAPSIALAPLTDAILSVPNCRTHRPVTFKRWILTCKPTGSPNHLLLRDDGVTGFAELSESQAMDIASRLVALSKGEDDYCIDAVEGDGLWFWCCGER